jgi:hypothetical protein
MYKLKILCGAVAVLCGCLLTSTQLLGQVDTRTEPQGGIIAHGVAFIDSGQNLMLVEGPTMQLIDFDGEVRCEWKQYPYHRRTASADGRWIAIADDQKVSVWKMTDLLQSCE